ncbi:MAG: response regulator [Alphaproteobacteria bacterium]
MTETILVVDDSTFACAYLTEILNEIGYEIVITAKDGMEGIDKFRAIYPDIVFLDIDMPVMNGLDALEILNNIKGTSRIIMISAVENRDIIDDCLLAGADDYIRKDQSEDVIKDRIREILC